jgi:hypothetical protein
MNDLQSRTSWIASAWVRCLVLCASSSAVCLSPSGAAVAQVATPTPAAPPSPVAQPPTVAQLPFSSVAQQTVPATTGAPFEPPLNPPGVAALPSGAGALSLGQWLLTPTLGLYTLYDSNLYSSPTVPVQGPGFHFHPALSADYNTGLWDTQLYGNLDSTVYPTLDYQNNTFNRQAGIIQKYSPLPDLVFTVQGDYTHNTQANVLINSLPTPISSPGSPPPSGTAGVVAVQQTVVNPNDVYTAQATIYKEFNRAFVNLNGQVATTQFEQQPSQNFNTKTYDGTGGFWLTPQLYAFGDGIQSFDNPEANLPSNYFRARGGLGTGRVGLFQGFVYYGQQGSEVYGGGKAGGDIYGGAVSYFPTNVWNMSFSVDRLRNISNITAGSPLGLGGLPFLPVGLSGTGSQQITALTFKSNYVFSPQTTGSLVASYSIGDQIGGPPLQTLGWLIDVGIKHQLWTDLSLTLDYQYTSFASPTPQTSFTRNLISIGALYTF